MWNHRKEYYIKSADYIIDTDTKKYQEIVNEIIKYLK